MSEVEATKLATSEASLDCSPCPGEPKYDCWLRWPKAGAGRPGRSETTSILCRLGEINQLGSLPGMLSKTQQQHRQRRLATTEAIALAALLLAVEGRLHRGSAAEARKTGDPHDGTGTEGVGLQTSRQLCIPVTSEARKE